jgi:hypothetical protein
MADKFSALGTVMDASGRFQEDEMINAWSVIVKEVSEEPDDGRKQTAQDVIGSDSA